MKCERKYMHLYAVTDRAWTGKLTLLEQIEEALKGGITCLQLREKEMEQEEFLEEAKQVKMLCEQYQVPLIINDNVEVALTCGADGVHVGQEDMPVSEVRRLVGDDMWIGVSAHSVEEAMEAKKQGADYLGVGSMFQTGTKKNAVATEFETLKHICESVDIPVVAIGGIKESNIEQLKGLGMSGVAVISAIFAAEDVEATTKKLYYMVEKII